MTAGYARGAVGVGELAAALRAGDPSALDRASVLLAEEDVGVRRSTLIELRKRPDPKIASEVRERLRDHDPMVLGLAARLAGELGDVEARPTLVSLTLNRDWFVRRSAALALGHVPHRDSIEALRSLLDDRSGAVRRAAAWALSNIRDADALEALQAARPEGLRTWLALRRARARSAAITS